MAKNNKEISSGNEIKSQTLESKLEAYVPPDLLKKLDNLKALGLDVALFEGYRDKVLELVKNNPNEVDVISQTMTQDLTVENLFSLYNDKFNDILTNGAANDENYVSGVDVLQVAQDDLTAYNTTPHLSGITENDIKDLSEQIEKQNKEDDNNDFGYNSTRHRKTA